MPIGSRIRSPGRRNEIAAIDQKIETAFEHVNELVLGRMDVRRHERAGWQSRVPGKRIFTELLWHIGLAEDVPDDAVDARWWPW